MIFYNEINTRVEKFSQIIKDDWFVSSIPMPKFIRVQKRLKLIDAYNSLMNNENEEDKNLNDDYYSYSLYIRILMYETLLRALDYGLNSENKALFKKLFHKEYKEEYNSLIVSKIERLKVSYDVIQTKTDTDEFNFDAFIKGISAVLDNKDISQIFIYQLPIEVEAAVKKINSDLTEKNQ